MKEKFVFDNHWSRRRGVSRLFLMVQDAHTLFAYWEVDEHKRALLSDHFEQPYAALPQFLRWYDVTDVFFDGHNAHCEKVDPVHPEADNWYIRNLQPKRRYLVDLVTQSNAGKYFTVLRSNVVETPPSKAYRARTETIKFMPPRIAVCNRDRQTSSPQPRNSVHTQLEAINASSTALFSVPYSDQFDGYSLS